MDLFISLTPCSGSLKFYISDQYKNLFTRKSEINGDNVSKKLDINSDSEVIVEHKTSKVGNG